MAIKMGRGTRLRFFFSPILFIFPSQFRLVPHRSSKDEPLATEFGDRMCKISLRTGCPSCHPSNSVKALKECCNKNEKSARRRRKQCTLGVVRQSQKFSPLRRPLPGGTERPKFNQLEMVTTFTYKPSLVKINACNFKLSW